MPNLHQSIVPQQVEQEEQVEAMDLDTEDELVQDLEYDSASGSDTESRSSSSDLSRTSSATSAATSVEDIGLPEDCFPTASTSTSTTFPQTPAPGPSTWNTLKTPCTFPAPSSATHLRAKDLETTLRFAAPGKAITDLDATAPPAFFPLQRVSFAPQLKIKTPGGVLLAMPSSKKHGQEGIAGMMLGVTGILEILDAEKSRKSGKQVVKSSRMIADFATDLTNGLKIWRRDAAPIVKEKLRIEREYRTHYNVPTEDLEDPSWDEMLAPGTFMLPLSMKIPCSEKLPPSFESSHFRIRYTMSLAIFGSRFMPDGKPEILHVHSVPFHILPSTLPTPPPQIPILTHDTRKAGFLAGISRALSLGGPAQAGLSTGRSSSDKTCTHLVCPSIPTTTFSPGSVVPVTLRIADCPTEPTDLYVRLSLIRKVYVRDSQYEATNEWGLPDEMFLEEFCKEEEEVVSRWGYVPYSIRADQGATPGSKAQVIISDITLPIGGAGMSEWQHGYSTHLDLGPAPAPTMKHGECSWFSPALSERQPVKADYERYVHASTRHFISIEVGFASSELSDTLYEISESIPEMDIPAPNTFSAPCPPTLSALSGLSINNPFPVAASCRTKRSQSSPFQHAPQLPSFPGKLKEILIPITIGSVAEPQMSCIVNRLNEAAQASIIPPTPSRPQRAATAEESAERAARDLDESEVERFERVGSDGEEAWILAPPCYKAALAAVPAYI